VFSEPTKQGEAKSVKRPIMEVSKPRYEDEDPDVCDGLVVPDEVLYGFAAPGEPRPLRRVMAPWEGLCEADHRHPRISVWVTFTPEDGRPPQSLNLRKYEEYGLVNIVAGMPQYGQEVGRMQPLSEMAVKAGGVFVDTEDQARAALDSGRRVWTQVARKAGAELTGLDELRAAVAAARDWTERKQLKHLAEPEADKAATYAESWDRKMEAFEERTGKKALYHRTVEDTQAS